MGQSPVLTELPFEILQRIGEHVEAQHAPSVASFATTSKRIYSTTAAVIWREIKILINQQDFYELVKWKHHRLERNSAFGHVRTLVIECGEHTKIAEDSPSWNVIVELLIDRCTGLVDLVFDCHRQFTHMEQTTLPKAVFYAIHNQHPRCRLHLYAKPFWLDDLYGPQPDPYKLDLITSPCLHSIALAYRQTLGFDTFGHPAYSEDELKSILPAAPNLKEIKIVRGAAGWSPMIADALSRDNARPDWLGFPTIEGNHPQATQTSSAIYNNVSDLETFRYDSEEPLTNASFRDWMTRIDPSALETLELNTFICLDPGEEFTCPKLAKIAINLYYPGSERQPDIVSDAWLGLKKIICQEHPLASLKVVGGLKHISWPLTSCQGTRFLKSLCLETRGDDGGDRAVGGESAKHFKKHFPLLEELTITMKRTQGDRREVQIYRDLGALPRLQSLSLTLDASNPTVLDDPIDDSDDDDNSPIISDNDPSFDEFDQKRFPNTFGSYRWPRNGHLRQALVNSALDRVLARAIFDCISAAKPSDAACRPLEVLTVRTTGGSDLGRSGMGSSPYPMVFEELMNCWTLERSVRDDKRDEIRITPKKKGNHPENTQLLPLELVPVFTRIWPSKDGNEACNWREHWFGLPLDLT